MSSFQMTGSFIISFNKNVFVAHPVLIVHKSFKGHDDDPERERAAVHSKVKNQFLKFRNTLEQRMEPIFFYFKFQINTLRFTGVSPKKLKQTFTF